MSNAILFRCKTMSVDVCRPHVAVRGKTPILMEIKQCSIIERVRKIDIHDCKMITYFITILKLFVETQKRKYKSDHTWTACNYKRSTYKINAYFLLSLYDLFDRGISTETVTCTLRLWVLLKELFWKQLFFLQRTIKMTTYNWFSWMHNGQRRDRAFWHLEA